MIFIFSLIIVLLITIIVIHSLLFSFAIKINKTTTQSYEANLTFGLITLLSLIIFGIIIIMALSLVNSKYLNISYVILIILYLGCFLISYFLNKNDSKDNKIIFALSIVLLISVVMLFLLKNVFIAQYKKYS